jgi:glutamyl-tRNA synthetase/nondiscriminating glutamyl-tRNA synthetase
VRPRVRFAPSPTGQLHVGNARTALYNWLFARRQGGTLVLRIEDTDAERSSLASERGILEDLDWMGLTWDEGPDIGGPHWPYRQSERQERYAGAARQLVDRGRAYHCFCTAEELEAERQQALAAGRPPRYSERCRALAPDVAAHRLERGEPAALRFAVPVGRDVTFRDVVRGPVTFSTDVIGDPVIVRSDGRPAYNFAVVVDDAAMEITHVVRGEDHVSNTPRQLLLYEALGLEAPVFAHLSLVLGPDHAPLSKRHGATSVGEFRDRGYLPEALVNYLALLGWSPGDNEELLEIGEMARRFDLSRVSHSAAVFDTGKLDWINRHYMKVAAPSRLAREALRYFELARLLRDDAASHTFVESLLPMVVGSVDRVEEIPDRVAGIFAWDAGRAAAMMGSEPNVEQVARAIDLFAREIAVLDPLDRETFRAAAGRVRQQTGLKGRDLFHPIRDALTAAASGPELDLIVPAIDRGARLPPEAVFQPIPSCAERARAVAALLQNDLRAPNRASKSQD